jgi:hypothetical protein
MKVVRAFILITFCSFISFYLFSCKDSAVQPTQESSKSFVKVFGGGLSDRASCVLQTADGGILVAGYTISAGAGGNDGFALKLDNNGSVQWYKVFGGSANDEINSACVVSDMGFILVGETASFASSSSDIYAVKLDMNGNLMWSKYYRIAGNEYGTSVVQTADYGFLISGSTDGFGTGNSDALVMKINFDGDLLWVKAYGDLFNDYGSSIKAFNDNSSIMVGYTYSGGAGGGDISMVRLNPNGVVDWTKYYGGGGLDLPCDLEITSDNGYIISGVTYSFGLSSGDEYFIKTDGNGYVYWSRTFGGSNLDIAFSIKQTNDGQYISAGVTGSYGAGAEDIFVTKIFGNGEFNLAKVFGAAGSDAGTGVEVRSSGDFVLAGYTQSYGAGNNDILVMSLKEDGKSCSADNPVIPNGGTPSTIVNNVTIVTTNASTYETVNAGTIINSISPAENTVCSQ